MIQGQTHVPTELTLVAEIAYEDIFTEVEVDVIFTGPDSRQWRVPAFWAGGQRFGARFAAPAPGQYAFRSVCNRPDDTGLHGRTGEIKVTPYPGDCELYRRGPLRVSEDRRYLQHADGTPVFWLADTWWMGLTSRLRWKEEFAQLAADRCEKGFTVIQIVAGPLPDFDAPDAMFVPQQSNANGWPWEPGWKRINPAFYDLADRRLAHLVAHGLIPCIVGMWGYWLIPMGVAKVKQHWRNLVARYASWPVVWCLAGELNMPTYSRAKDEALAEADRRTQREGWTEVARYVRQIDPYHHPLGAHPSWSDPGRDMLLDESLMDIDLLQTGHSGQATLANTVRRVREAVARSPRMPVINSEVNYEGIMGGSWQDIQRFCLWTCLTGGACGHTYGAQGIWAMSSRHEPFRGSTDSWGDACWQDAMHYAGSAQMQYARKLFDRYPWWRLEAREEPDLPDGRLSAYAAGIPRTLGIWYLPCNHLPAELQGMSMGWHGVAPVAVEPGASYTAFYHNPRTGDDLPIGPVTPTDGRWTPPRTPSKEDWVLVLEDKAALASIGRE